MFLTAMCEYFKPVERNESGERIINKLTTRWKGHSTPENNVEINVVAFTVNPHTPNFIWYIAISLDIT